MSYRHDAPGGRGRGAPSAHERELPPSQFPAARPKQALSHVGGHTEVRGEPRLGELLAYALDVGDVSRDALTHGFHTYPARMHWATAVRLIEELKLSGAHLLDPFCGSGTTLVEARTHGLRSTGADLNPLAVRLSALKTDPRSRSYRESLVLSASEVRAASEELVQARAKVRANLPPGEIRWYEPHVLKEMAGLCQCIGAVDDEDVREAFVLVFSSLVVKFSRQRSDTSEHEVERSLRKGLVSEFFERKANELADRLEALSQAVEGPPPALHVADARHAPDYVSGPVDVVLTSPPYGGTYDYAAHHARRFAWLGIEPGVMAREIGARRDQEEPQRFERALYDVLLGFRRVLTRDGIALVLMGDGVHRGELVRADELMSALAEDAGLTPLAVASQSRPDFRGGEARAEHLMAFAVA
jgi:DNA modification methylase